MNMRFMTRQCVALLVLAVVTACSGPKAPPPQESATTATLIPPADDAPIPETASPYDALPQVLRDAMDVPFRNDFDAMVKRRLIRVGVTFNRTHYFIDRGQERGVTYETLN